MLIKQKSWPIERFVRDKNKIDLNPNWQRGAAWKKPRQVLLIDSILRGMDIPKVYLRKLKSGAMHSHDAVDGQQRLRAIWEFCAGEFSLDYLETLPDVDGHTIEGKKYSELHKSLRSKIDKFEVSIAEIRRADIDEITNLFSRLQMGVSLNPAELRNAIMGPMRHVIDAVARSHEFFQNCRIPDSRYKRQDYTTHVFAMAAYSGSQNIKAQDLKRMVEEYGPDRSDEVLELSARVGDALNVIAEVNELAGYKITQKWIFVDLCWLVMQRQTAGFSVDPQKLNTSYEAFEGLRKSFGRSPETLIRQGRPNPARDRHLYNYINAFKLQAGAAASLKTRNEALKAFCPDIDRTA